MTQEELDYIALRVVQLLKKDSPKWISQNKAYKLYGGTRVTRLREQGKVTTSKVANTIQYRLSDLEKCEGIKML